MLFSRCLPLYFNLRMLFVCGVVVVACNLGKSVFDACLNIKSSDANLGFVSSISVLTLSLVNLYRALAQQFGFLAVIECHCH